MLSPYILTALVAVVAIHFVVHRDRNWIEEVPEQNLIVRLCFHTSLLLLLVCLGATEAAPFIYFQF